MAAAHDGSRLPTYPRRQPRRVNPAGCTLLPLRFACSPCAAAARRSAVASSIDEVIVGPPGHTSGRSRGDRVPSAALPTQVSAARGIGMAEAASMAGSSSTSPVACPEPMPPARRRV